MRYVSLKSVPIRLLGVPDEAPAQAFNYADAILGLINAWGAESERGLPLTEVAKGVALAQAVEGARRAGAEVLELEEADWQTLNGIAQGFKGWRLVHPCVAQFVTDVATAPQQRPAATPAPAPQPHRSGRRR